MPTRRRSPRRDRSGRDGDGARGAAGHVHDRRALALSITEARPRTWCGSAGGHRDDGTLAVRDLGSRATPITSGGLSLGTAKIDGTASLDVRDHATAETLEVGGSLTAKGGVLVLGTTTVRALTRR
jgi:hypothetical protein